MRTKITASTNTPTIVIRITHPKGEMPTHIHSKRSKFGKRFAVSLLSPRGHIFGAGFRVMLISVRLKSYDTPRENKYLLALGR